MVYPVRSLLKVSSLALLGALAVLVPNSAYATTLIDVIDSKQPREPHHYRNVNQRSPFEHKQLFMQSIVQAVGGEPNQAEQTRRCLNTLLSQDDLDLPQELVSRLQKLLESLLQPEYIISKDHKLHFLQDLSPTLNHPALAGLKKAIQELAAVIPSVPASLHTSLKNLQSHYTDYLDRLLDPTADRLALLHPKAILSGEGLVSSQAEGIRSYRISQQMAYTILCQDKYGLSLKRNTTGSHAVCHQEPVYFKGNTTGDGLPVGREAKSYLFAQALFKRGMAPTLLLTLNEVESHKPTERSPAGQAFSTACRNQQTSDAFFRDYPQYQDSFTQEIPHHVLQASQEVWGLTLQVFLEQGGSFNDLCLESFSEHIILSLLLNPSDAKADNFMVQQDQGAPYKIIGIDNDKAFGASIVQQNVDGQAKHYPGVKNILYLLSLMEEAIPSAVRDRLLSISPEHVILQWLSYLQHQEDRYQQLSQTSYHDGFSTVPYLSSQRYRDDLLLPLKVDPYFIAGMTQRLHQIQCRLQGRPATTHRQLFHVIDPVTAHFYQTLGSQTQSSILAVFQKILHDNHEELFFENILANQMEDCLSPTQTIRQALTQENRRADESAAQTHSVKEARLHFLRHLDLAHHKTIGPVIEMAADLYKELLQEPQQLHASWFQDDLLLHALEDQTSVHGIKFLVDLGLNIRFHDPESQQNVFHKAAHSACSQTLFELLTQALSPEEQQIFLNSQDNRRRTPLDYALLSNSEIPVMALINLGSAECSPSLALKFYKAQSVFSPQGSTAFQKLIATNPAVEWEIALEELLPPLTSVSDSDEMTLYLSQYGSRRLPQDIQAQLFDPQGQFISCHGQGNHVVSRVQRQGRLELHHLYFKVYPALPGLEEASGCLTRQLLGFGAPYTDLAQIGNYPVLISQGIWGPTLLNVLQNNSEMLKDLVDDDVSGLIMAAMLINPEDGKPDNYIVAPHPTQEGKYRLVGIDNDQAFVPAIVKEKPDREFFSNRPIPVAQVKTILYCLDQMKQPIASSIRTRLINLSLDVFLQDWLKGLKRLNQSYNALFTAQDQTLAFKKFESFIGVPFQQGAVGYLYGKLVDLRDLLMISPNLTHIELLSKLDPRLCKRYQAALDQDLSPLQRFQEVDSPFYEVNKDGSHITLTKSGMILKSASIPLQNKTMDAIRLGQENSPIQGLEELAQIVKEKSDQALEGLAARVGDLKLLQTLALEQSRAAFLQQLIQQNKVLSPPEQNAVLQYLTQQKRIRKLLIPRFNMLVDGYFASPLWLEHLTDLDMRYCSGITNTTLIALSDGAPVLEILNLGSLPQLAVIKDSRFFTPRSLSFPSLHTLNLSECINLTKIFLEVPNLTWLDVSGCNKLTDDGLDSLITGSPNLDRLGLRGCLRISHRELREEFPKCPLSTETIDILLKIFKNKESCLNLCSKKINLTPRKWEIIIHVLASNATLKSLDLSNSQIGDIGAQALAGNTTLTSLNLRRNLVGDAGAQALARNTTLTSLDLGYNQVNYIGFQALAGNTTLTSMNLHRNQVGDAGAQALALNTTLTCLNLQRTQIGDTGAQALALNTTLTSLNLRRNLVGDIGAKALAGNTTLKFLSLRGNQMTETGAQAFKRNKNIKCARRSSLKGIDVVDFFDSI